MSENKPTRRFRDKPPSIFFPLLLIAIGVYFLLINLNVLPGNFWNTIWRLWPVLFIAGGLDGLIRREGMVTNSLFIVLGIVFLLCNFNYLQYSILELIFLLWPLILVAIGFDLIVGKKSIWISLAGVAVFLVILFGALWYVGAGASAGEQMEVTEILQPLNGAEQATVDLAIGAGTITLAGLDNESNLIEGDIPSSDNITTTQSYTVEAGTGQYRLKNDGVYFYTPGTQSQQWTWDLQVNNQIPIDLQMSVGAGTVVLDLVTMNLSDLTYSLGAGTTEIYLPEGGNFQGAISMAVGTLTIYVPAGLEMRINTDTALTAVSMPDSYSKQNDIYTSPGFATGENQVELKIDNAVGTVVIQER